MAGVYPSEELPTTNELPIETFVDESEDEDEHPLSIPEGERRLVTQPNDFIIRSLSQQVTDGFLVLADKFQRRRVWDETKASRLIESLLLNVPIPVCYFAELEDGRYSVIDGQQRLTAIYRYINNEFNLRGLKVRAELNRKRFHELNNSDQRAITSRTIRCIVILKESHPDIRFEVFERLNSGSVKLNRQELRNSMYRGALNDAIKELTDAPLFLNARRARDVDRRMNDCEMVLRFFAFYFRAADYQGELAPFLDKYLRDGMHMSVSEIAWHKKLFLDTLQRAVDVFGKDCFRRANADGTWENAINRAVYDVMMLCFARAPVAELEKHKDDIREKFLALCQDKQFSDAITFSTKDKKKIQSRIDGFRMLLVNIGVPIDPIKIGP